MADTATWALAGVVLLGAMSPGPDFVLVVRNSLASGRTVGLANALGIGAGVLVWAIAAVGGLAGLLATSTVAFTLVKYCGAAYLIYLGLRSLHSAMAGDPRPSPDAAAHVSRRAAFTQGLTTNLLNPKTAAFFVALLPQFLPSTTDGPAALYTCLVITTVTTGWFALVASAAGGLRSGLSRPRVRRTVDAAAGALLVALGLRIATS